MLPYKYQFRIVVIGDSMVGKSSLLKSFIEGSCNTVCDPTIGVDFFCRTVNIDENSYVKLQLWDTAGQEKYRSITTSYYRECVGVLIVFDLTERSTFEHIPVWHEEAQCSIRCQTPVFVIVGHKADRHADRQVTKIEAQSLAQRLGDIVYIETSSVTGQNVEQAFKSLAQSIYANVTSGYYNELCAGGVWEGVKQGQNALIATEVVRRSIRLGGQDEQRSKWECCS